MDLRLAGANIVIVFKSVELSQISTDKFKAKFMDVAPRFLSLDPVLVSNYQELRGVLIINLPDRGLEARVGNRTKKDYEILADLLHHGLAAVNEPQIAAFGINYLANLDFDERTDAREFSVNRFLKSDLSSASDFKGDLFASSPTIYFLDKETRYQFAFGVDINEGKGMDVSLNVHRPAQKIPNAKDLKKIVLEEYAYFLNSVNQIFDIVEK